jgi:hypothetical protein
LAQAARLSVFIAPPGKSGLRFKSTVLTNYSTGNEIRWLGHLLIQQFLTASIISCLNVSGNIKFA